MVSPIVSDVILKLEWTFKDKVMCVTSFALRSTNPSREARHFLSPTSFGSKVVSFPSFMLESDCGGGG